MPDFVGIGSIRSGSTWLWENLRKHPSIAMPNTKELHFFNRQWDKNYLPLLPRNTERKCRYASRFLPVRLLNPKKCIGEISPAYAILPDEKKQVFHKWMPNAKLLFIIREPLARTWSHILRRCTQTGEQVEQMSDEEIIGVIENTGIKKQSMYLENLQSWLTYYPQEQIHILCTEDCSTAPKETLQSIFRFLSIEENPPIDWGIAEQREHIGPTMPISKRVKQYVLETYYSQQQALEKLIGRQLPWDPE